MSTFLNRRIVKVDEDNYFVLDTIKAARGTRRLYRISYANDLYPLAEVGQQIAITSPNALEVMWRFIDCCNEGSMSTNAVLLALFPFKYRQWIKQFLLEKGKQALLNDYV